MLDLAGVAFALVGAWLVGAASDAGLARWAPQARGILSLSPAAAFTLGFVGLDYVQYWVHRAFHGGPLWRLHLLHHTLPERRAIGAYRHTAAEYAASPTLWLNGVVLGLLEDPSWYALALTTGAMLEVWRHSSARSVARGPLGRLLVWALITPDDHAVHHRHPQVFANFGANLKVWDRLHGTFVPPETPGTGRHGVDNDDTALRLLLIGARPSDGAPYATKP